MLREHAASTCLRGLPDTDQQHHGSTADNRANDETGMKRIIVGITGATGAIFGIRLLEVLRTAEDVETHLVMSKWAMQTIEHETTYTLRDVRDLASVVHEPGNMGATISSGSFRTDGM